MRGTAGTQQEVINMSQSAFLTQHYIICFLYYDIIDPINTHDLFYIRQTQIKLLVHCAVELIILNVEIKMHNYIIANGSFFSHLLQFTKLTTYPAYSYIISTYMYLMGSFDFSMETGGEVARPYC